MDNIDFDAEERRQLDHDFDLRARCPDSPAQFAYWAEASENFRATAGGMLDVPYGAHPLEKVDIFLPQNPKEPPPCCIFLHPGSWQRLDKSLFSFLAAPLVARGCAVIMVNYPLVPDVSLEQIVGSVVKCLKWVIRGDSGGNIDISRIAVLGHSAGGHLATTIYTSNDVFDDRERAAIRVVAAIGGFYDLEAVRKSFMNDALKLTPDIAEKFSPLRRKNVMDCDLILAVGERETSEFLKQHSLMAAHMRDLGKRVEEVPFPEQDHFSLVKEVARLDSAFMEAVAIRLL